MTNFAVAFKDDVRKQARKEIRSQTAVLRRSSAQHRRDIAALKRTIAVLQKQLKRGGVIAQASASADTVADGQRFSARSVRAQRKRLGLSAADFGRLVGASALSVYHWESGKSHPRESKLTGFYAVRGIGRREALAKLGKVGGKRRRKRGE